MSRESIKEEALRLRRPGSTVRCVDSGENVVVILEPYSPPEGESYSPNTFDALAFVVPTPYREASPDPTGFYVKPSALLAAATRRTPQSASPVQLLDEAWLKFSWSPKGPPWDPEKDNLETYLATIEKRFLRRV